MKKIIHKVGQALQLVLLAPVKLPAKVLQVCRYVALGLGILETVLDKDKDADQEVKPTEGNSEKGVKNENE